MRCFDFCNFGTQHPTCPLSAWIPHVVDSLTHRAWRRCVDAEMPVIDVHHAHQRSIVGKASMTSFIPELDERLPDTPAL